MVQPAFLKGPGAPALFRLQTDLEQDAQPGSSLVSSVSLQWQESCLQLWSPLPYQTDAVGAREHGHTVL